ncbi:hypothetical protein EMCRGX_G024088 [Ephydatia muelleri]
MSAVITSFASCTDVYNYAWYSFSDQCYHEMTQICQDCIRLRECGNSSTSVWRCQFIVFQNPIMECTDHLKMLSAGVSGTSEWQCHGSTT